LLRAHISTGKVDQALTDMDTLEKSGGGESLTQLYFGLGRLLEKEMASHKEKGDSAALERTQTAFQRFLAALANAKAGQTYESLEWAGENMLKLGNPKEAGDVFRRILETYGKDTAFLARTDSAARVLRTRLKLAESLRGEGDFAEAEKLVMELKKENPKAIEPLIEEGHLLEDKAAATGSAVKTAAWNASYTHWKTLATRLQSARPRPPEYYDAWYHAALALYGNGKPALATQTLRSVMRLSPQVGNPEIRQKYDALLAKLNK
jgi:tetratricopeptide (TPR) repeat protein